MTDEQTTWFNSLPIEKSVITSQPHQRTCVCGSSIFYGLLDGEYNGTEDRAKLESWIDLHWQHTGAQKINSKSFKYDWSIDWKFSEAGFDAFKNEFGLLQIWERDVIGASYPDYILDFAADSPTSAREYFVDAKDNIFTFYPNYTMQRYSRKFTRTYSEGLFVTFDANLSYVK